MDIVVKTPQLVEVLKIIHLLRKTGDDTAPKILYINDDYAIIGNVVQAQIEALSKQKFDWC